MTTCNALFHYALNNSWANPRTDRQHNIELHRLSRPDGAMRYQEVLYDNVFLPTIKDDVWHVFQIGQNHPFDWNVGDDYITPIPSEEWIRVDDLCERRLLVANFYTDNGIQFPRSQVYIRLRYDHNIIVAIKELPAMKTPKNIKIYFHCYSNAYYTTLNEKARTGMISCFGGVMSDRNQVLKWQQKYKELQKKSGYVQAHVNGKLVDDFKPGSYKASDYLDVFYDGSVFKTIDFQVSQLSTFKSELDKRRKYILHPYKDGTDDVWFYDDVEYHVINQKAGYGVLYHKNLPDAVRQLTHRDWSIPVQYVSRFTNEFSDWTNNDELIIRATIRNSGWDNKLIYEHHRIKELYKFNDYEIMNGLVGLNSVLPEWSAANLEQSGYSLLLGTQYEDMTCDQLKQAYGYNAMTRILAESPVQTQSTPYGPGVQLNYTLRKNATIYEYNAAGLLLGYHYHDVGEWYYARDENCAFIEARGGKATKTPDYVLGTDPVNVDSDLSFRCYATTVNSDGPTDNWVDVTNDTKWVTIKDGVVTWNMNPSRYVGLVLTNKSFIGYDFDLDYTDKSLYFAVTHTWPHGGQLTTIPPARLDIWMNSCSLIENLDYYVEWPRIVIVNKDYINIDKPQHIVVRCSGFSDEKLQREKQGDVGWLEYGQVSINKTYNLRDDRVVRCIVNGCVRFREELVYNEDVVRVKKVSGVPDGKPYQISNVVVPLYGIADWDSYYLRDKSQDLDKRLSDYLTTQYPAEDMTSPITIDDRYRLYSPFMAKIANDIKLKLIQIGVGWGSDEKLDDIVSPYKWWLAYDPCTHDDVDLHYVTIHPHNEFEPYEVTEYEYSFLSRVNELYLNNRVELSGHFKIKGS